MNFGFFLKVWFIPSLEESSNLGGPKHNPAGREQPQSHFPKVGAESQREKQTTTEFGHFLSSKPRQLHSYRETAPAMAHNVPWVLWDFIQVM